MVHPSRTYTQDWRTLALTRTPLGLTAEERAEGLTFEAVTELVLRLAGAAMIAASILLWLILPPQAAAPDMLSHGMLFALCAWGGFAVYAYGSRGFRRMVVFDATRGVLTLTKLNVVGQSRITRSMDVGDIESVFLCPPPVPLAPASLRLRLAGSGSCLLALKGNRSELRKIHRELCDSIRGGGAHPHLVTRQPRCPTGCRVALAAARARMALARAAAGTVTQAG
ncbi:MAG: hypothetical protein Kow0058_08970 [Roseovarius sp.]